MSDEKLEQAIFLLRQKFENLGTLPKRSDFSPEEVCFIKQKLGPWPRALESAGLKQPPKISAAEKSRQKRERSKQRRREQKKALSSKEKDTLVEKQEEVK